MRAKEYFDIILEKIDKIEDTQNRQEKVQVEQQHILNEHMRRTAANEKQIEIQQGILDILKKEFVEVSKDTVRWSFIGKALANISIILGIIGAGLKLFGKI